MNKENKQKAQEFIKLLMQALDEITLNLKQKKIAETLELLQQCQQGAIQLGTMLEKSEGEGFVTVKFLEEYCELVYQTHQVILLDQRQEAEKKLKILRKLLLRIQHSVDYDIKTRREVVFLPYKASMWDSLESVWKAAVEDSSCDAYVIPIPYYDKNPDGSFGAEHYEGGAYPDYVPITDYKDYDFKGRRPDMIFIHCPYDEHNFVTSVHPFFYSKNLKQYTERLVYIPYFVVDEIKPDNKEEVEKIKHFCLESACFHAHTIIVQSESIRQVYVNVLSDALGEHTRTYWEEKILGIGSPKIDKVVSMKKEQCSIPKEWLRIIKKSDGSWKKIVLYNISLTTLLEQERKMLTKVKDALQLFKKRQDSIALLWRPHPLMRETIKSMRQHLLTEYDAIVEQYKSERWGIYDDTVDVNRAIALSDAYFGTDSSVVKLYEASGKPVMIQNAEVLSNAK